MKDLQEIINKRARNRAHEEVRTFIKAIHFNSKILRILKDVEIVIKKTDNRIDTDDMRSVFWREANAVPKMIIEKLTELYIPEESEDFIKKVEELSDQIDELKNY